MCLHYKNGCACTYISLERTQLCAAFCCVHASVLYLGIAVVPVATNNSRALRELPALVCENIPWQVMVLERHTLYLCTVQSGTPASECQGGFALLCNPTVVSFSSQIKICSLDHSQM